MTKSGNGTDKKPKLRSRLWFDDPHDPGMTALYLERYLNYGLTRNELQGLMDEMLTSAQAPNGVTKISEWLEKNKKAVGRSYSSEIARHFRYRATGKCKGALNT